MSDRHDFENIRESWNTYGRLTGDDIKWLIDKLEEYLPEELE